MIDRLTFQQTNLESTEEKSFKAKAATPRVSASVVYRYSHCTLRYVQTDEEFDAIRNEWQELVQHSNVSVFQTYEWLRTWWAYFGKNRLLNCLVFSCGNKTVGIVPMYFEYFSLLGFHVATRLRVMGSPISDYTDFIIAPGYEDMVLHTFTKYLRNIESDWDVFDIEDLNENSKAFQILPLLFEMYGVKVHTYQGNVCPHRSLPVSWELFLQSIGPNLKNNLKRKTKKLQEQYQSEVEVFERTTDDLPQAIDSFAHIHGQRWKSFGFPSAFDSEDHRKFHLDIARQFAERGWLKIYFLKINGERVATSFNFDYRKRIYMYQCNAFASDEIMKLSPGVLIKAMTIQRGIAEGMKVYDFLRGDEPYKYEEWKSENSKNWLVRGSSPCRRGQFRFTIFLMRELALKIFDRCRREHFEYKRFNATRRPSLFLKAKFIINRTIILLGLGRSYILRHISSSADKSH